MGHGPGAIRGRGSRCGAHRERPDVRVDPGLARAAGRPPGSGRSSRSAASGRRRRRTAGRRVRCSASCSTATAPARLARCWRVSGTARSSTAASCSPIASERTRPAWPAPEDRYASDLLLPDRVADPWLRELTRVRDDGPDPDPARRPHARGTGPPPGAAPGPTSMSGPGLAPPPATRPRRGRERPGARCGDPRRDRARRPDHVRSLHGAGALRAGARLLPLRGAATRPWRRLPDRTGGASDVRAMHSPASSTVSGRRSDRRIGSRSASPGPGAERSPRRSSPRLAADDPALAAAVRYRAAEIEPRRVEDLHARVAAAGLDGRLENDDGTPIVGLGIANEVLDALPTHRVVMRGGRLREVLVGIRGGAFVDVEAAPTTPALARRLEDEGIRSRRGPAGRSLPRARRLDRPGRRRSRARRPAAHRLRRPGGEALRPAAPVRAGRCSPICAIAPTTTSTRPSAGRT